MTTGVVKVKPRPCSTLSQWAEPQGLAGESSPRFIKGSSTLAQEARRSAAGAQPGARAGVCSSQTLKNFPSHLKQNQSEQFNLFFGSSLEK